MVRMMRCTVSLGTYAIIAQWIGMCRTLLFHIHHLGITSFAIVWQTIIVLCWMILNVVAIISHWDPYPYILLNLVFSTQAAYAAPIIMMAQNRQNERDRAQADADFKTNCEAKVEIEDLQKRLNAIEVDKLDKIIAMIEEMKIQKA